MTIGAEKLAFGNFAENRFPALISDITKDKVFFSGVFVMKLKCCLMAGPPTSHASTAQEFYGSGLRPITPDFCVAGTAAGSPPFLVILELLAA